jgi:hypothetical protein
MKTSILSLTLAVLLTVIIYGCSGEDKPKTDKGANINEEVRVDSALIRNRNTDLSSLDTNNDDRVFQCMMDYNVVSDEPGQCPLCKMKLKELSIDKAQSNFNKFFEDQNNLNHH